MMIGDMVRFRYLQGDLPRNKPPVIKIGKVIEATKTGYLVEIRRDADIKCMNGTICNRNAADIIEVLK